MIDKSKPIVVAICGKSASGKDSIAHKFHQVLLEHDCDNHFVVSATSRPKRVGERDGVDYMFIDKEEFIKHPEKFIEYTEFNGWYYGIPKDQITDGMNIAVVNPQGLKTLVWEKDKYTIIPVLLKAPIFTRLRRSIKREGRFRWEHLRRIFADNRDFRDFETFFQLQPNALVYKSFHGIFNKEDDRIYILNSLLSQFEQWQLVKPGRIQQV